MQAAMMMTFISMLDGLVSSFVQGIVRSDARDCGVELEIDCSLDLRV